jgi:hypothetical protein
MIDPFDYVNPCEPDCTPERHWIHQIQWNMAVRINVANGYEPYPGLDKVEDLDIQHSAQTPPLKGEAPRESTDL